MSALRNTDSNKPTGVELKQDRCQNLIWSAILQAWDQCRNHPKEQGKCGKHLKNKEK